MATPPKRAEVSSGNRVLGLLVEFCAQMKLSDFADKLGITAERVIELVVRGLGEPEVPPTRGGDHGGGKPGGGTPPSGKGPATDRGASGERGSLLAPATAVTAQDRRRVYDSLDLAAPTPVPPAEFDLVDDDETWDEIEDELDADPPVAEERKRGHTVKRLTKDELRIGALLWPERAKLPVNRGACCSMPRPCPFVRCRYHLYTDVNENTGSIKFNYGEGIEPWDLKESCTLDVADQGGRTLAQVAETLNVTRERVRQIEARALMKLVESDDARELLDAMRDMPVEVSIGQLYEAEAFTWQS